MGILDAPVVPRDRTGRRLDSLRVADVRRELSRRTVDRSRFRPTTAAPPTITVASASSTNGVAIDPVSTLPECLVGGRGWAHPTNGWNVASWWRTDRALDVNGFTVAGYKIMVYCDKAKFEAQFYVPAGGSYRVKVDDEYVSPLATSFGVSGATRWLQMDFGSDKVRRIVIETAALIIALKTDVTGTIWPAKPRGPRHIAFGDSYTGGATGANGAAYTTWLSAAADSLGWEDTYQNAVGSTGYLETIGGYANTVAGQVARAVAAGVTPEVVICTAGHNDTQPQSSIVAAAVSAFAAMRAAWPSALIVCGGPWWVGGATAMAAWAARETAIFSAVDADVFIPQATGPGVPWFTGSGRVGATTGSGNSDAYVYSDNVHPTQAGHDYAGVRFAEALREALSA
jgi:lysophospholipase L1-like esterase